MHKTLLFNIALLLLIATAQPAAALVDTDADGVADNVDNCIISANADQRDSNGDGIGNACDPDLNDDCSVNFADLQVFKQLFFTADDDADLTGDGLVNFADLAIVKQSFFTAPGPSGGQNECSCVPPAAIGGNAEFSGDDVYLLGSLAGAGNAVPGLNNFSDQGNGLYVARIYSRLPGAFDYRVGNLPATIDYCTDELLMPYGPVDVPVTACAAPGPLEIPTNGCYEFVLDTNGEVLPPSVELTLVERLGRWDIDVTPAGGTFMAPNGVQFDVPAGAVAAATTLTIGDLPCQQIDALFAQTTLNSHDNRCLGGLVGEPSGFAFALPVDVTVPADPVTPADEVLIAVANAPGRQDYIVLETEVGYDAATGSATASIDELNVFAVAGAIESNPVVQRGPALEPCCSQTPTPLDCCCRTYRSASTAGDATSTDCDCELVANEIVTEFPLCPGMPMFVDRMSHSSENCPTDFTATLDSPDTTLWRCEQRVVSLSLTGTNADGQVCSMPVPFTWSVDNTSVATVDELPPGSSARVTGVSAGTTNLNSASNVGTQFSVTTPLTVVDVDGPFLASESGSQTCVIDGGPFTEGDSDFGILAVGVNAACNMIGFDIGIPNVAGVDGALTVTGNPAAPLTFLLQAMNAPNTLGCLIFFDSDAADIDFGEPFCPPGSGALCEALSCSETTTTNGQFGTALSGMGSGDSSWTFNASWSATDSKGGTTFHGATCNGSSTVTFTKQ